MSVEEALSLCGRLLAKVLLDGDWYSVDDRLPDFVLEYLVTDNTTSLDSLDGALAALEQCRPGYARQYRELLARGAQRAHLGIVTGRFTHARLDILNVGYLGTQVEMEQLHAIQAARLATMLDGTHQLRRAQAKFRFLAPGVLPVTLADTHQPHPQTDTR